MAPNPLKCLKTGCEWVTPPNCPTWEHQIELLKIHTSVEHHREQGAATNTYLGEQGVAYAASLRDRGAPSRKGGVGPIGAYTSDPGEDLVRGGGP